MGNGADFGEFHLHLFFLPHILGYCSNFKKDRTVNQMCNPKGLNETHLRLHPCQQGLHCS